MEQVELMAEGAIALAFGVAGLFFLRFWRDTRDRLFALFALAFGVLAANRVGIALAALQGARGDHLYWVRFCAFALILAAIVDKNRSRPPPRP
jgi:Family of unknown function (DUF5985)